MSADAGGRRRMMLLALVCGACINWGSSGNEPEVDVTAPRLLDELCKTNAYTLEGAAVRTGGLTEDSCGFELGPGAGSVEFTLDALTTVGGSGFTTKISALLVDLDGDGPRNARWVPYVELDEQSRFANSDQVVRIGTVDRHIGVVDLEVWTSTPPVSGCSVARRPTGSARSQRGPHR